MVNYFYAMSFKFNSIVMMTSLLLCRFDVSPTAEGRGRSEEAGGGEGERGENETRG